MAAASVIADHLESEARFHGRGLVISGGSGAAR